MPGPPPPPPPPPPPGGRPPQQPPPPPGGAPPPARPFPAPGHPSGGVPPSAGTNGMAIASLVLGIVSIPLCFVFVPALLAVIFGAIALRQITSTPGQSGRGQAIAGLVLGGVSLLFIVLALVFAGSTSFDYQPALLAIV